MPFADFILLKINHAFYILDCWSVPDILFSALYAVSVPSSRPQKGVMESVLWILSSRTSTEKPPFQAMRREKQNSRINLIIIEIQFLNIISWPTLFFFEVASSLIVLHCTLRKIQPNIQGGGA